MTPRSTPASILALWLAVTGCGDDGGGDDASAQTTTDTTATTTPATSTTTAVSTAETTDDPTVTTGVDATDDTPPTGDGPMDSSSSDSDDPPLPPGVIYEEDFEGLPDGEAWPTPWEEGGTAVLSSDIDAGRGRFNGMTATVARMLLPDFMEVDVDIAFTVHYQDYSSQGVGFYARQNGGVLHQTPVPGEGYAVYVEGGFMQNFGIWRENDGVEVPIIEMPIDPPIDIQDLEPYRIRFQCFTMGADTRLRARIWPAGDAEPDAWLIDINDNTSALQGTPGSFAIDVYNYSGQGSLFIDDIIIERMEPT